MDGLTAKVFRTYNASITLQAQLKELTSGTSLCDITLCHALIRGPCDCGWHWRRAWLDVRLVRSSLQRRKTFLPRSCPTTGPTEPWPSCATIRGLRPRLLRSPCRTCRLRSEHSVDRAADVWSGSNSPSLICACANISVSSFLWEFLWVFRNLLLHCPIFLLQIDAKKAQLSAAKQELKGAKADAKVRKDEKSKK